MIAGSTNVPIYECHIAGQSLMYNIVFKNVTFRMNEWRTENSSMQADTLTKRKKKEKAMLGNENRKAEREIENGGDIRNKLDQ
jgi:hypothetical protein